MAKPHPPHTPCRGVDRHPCSFHAGKAATERTLLGHTGRALKDARSPSGFQGPAQGIPHEKNTKEYVTFWLHCVCVILYYVMFCYIILHLLCYIILRYIILYSSYALHTIHCILLTSFEGGGCQQF